jgi:predicted signal transduction protein with EAL and GGDEF domain/DNA-binding response OmpR family regulator
MTVAPYAQTHEAAACLLLVDDDPMGRLLTGRALRERGFEVIECDRAEAALELIGREAVDCVIADVLMPGIDGFEFVRRVRASDRGALVPILMLTSLDEDEATRRAYESGASDYCVKTLNWTLLVHRIRQLLRLGRLERAVRTEIGDDDVQEPTVVAAAFEWQPAARRVRASTDLFRLLAWRDPPALLAERALLLHVTPADRRSLRRAFVDMLRGGRAVRYEVGATTRSGVSRRLRIEVHQVATTAGGALEISGAVHDVTPAGVREATLYRLTHFDAVTGLPNRTWLLERLARPAVPGERGPLAVAVVSIDRFHQVGEALGQLVSDRLLVEIARRLRRLTAVTADRPAGADDDGSGRIESVVNLGTDGFALVFDGVPDARAALALARGAVEILREPFGVGGRELFLRASIGVHIAAREQADPHQRLARAERARHAAAAGGGDRALVYESSMSTPAFDRLEMERDLHYALERGELVMHYQPQIDATRGRVIGFEALMRWSRGGRLQAAGQFIPLAEETGLIVPMGEWAIGESCEALARIRADGLVDCTLSVNLSCQQLRSGSLRGILAARLAEHHVPAEALEVELTESGMMSDPELAVAELRAVRELGVGLAVDDFGTGYSSLSYLTRLPLSTLKIDRAFVNDLHASERSRAVARAIVALGANLNLRVVAEGVETEAQRDALLELGCTLQQGYLYGRAMPLAEALAFAQAFAQACAWRPNAAVMEVES